MGLQPIFIAGYNSGLTKNKKPFLLTDDAFETLDNAYVYRERVVKKDGNTFVGRLRRAFSGSLGLSIAGTWPILNIYSTFVPPIVPEATAEIQPGSVIITIQTGGPGIVFTDQGDGTLTGSVAGNSGTINYLNGDIVLTNTAPANTPTIVTFGYFPSLPVMGLPQREIPAINAEQTIEFDTTYAYIYNGTNFQEFIPGTTWSGTDSDFFWSTNFRGTLASTRLFFTTNFVNNAANPIRYTEGTTWTDFAPILNGSEGTVENLGSVVSPWTTFTGTVLQTPIVAGTVTITVSNSIPAETVTFTDPLMNGTLTGNPPANTGTIDYTTGVITLNFVPALTEDAVVTITYTLAVNFLWQARIIIPYYGMLLFMNTWEGVSRVTATNYFARCTFSQPGNPIDSQAFRRDLFGRGGYVDAPTNERITGAIFFKNTLIVKFERSTWQLRYVGEYGTPFIFERISSDYGSESTFSDVLFDDYVASVGDKAIVASTSVKTERIDLEIPDTVFSLRNTDAGPERVYGIRNFQKELVYWSYSDSNLYQQGTYTQTFPNYVLLWNYRNKTWARLRENITAFGTLQSENNITWDSVDITWNNEAVFWDDPDNQTQFPFIICGNQQGFINKFDDTTTVAQQASLSISAVNLTTSPIQITVNNHNLFNNEVIWIQDLNFTVASAPVATNINDNFYSVQAVDANTLALFKFFTDPNDPEDSAFVTFNYTNFAITPVNTATYIGRGTAALMPRMDIVTKDFNPYQNQGLNFKSSYIDFQLDSNESEVFTVKLYINSYLGQEANLQTGQKDLETYLPTPYYPLASQYAWHRFFATTTGQYMRIQMTFSDALMAQLATHQQDWELNAMRIWLRPAGKVIF